MDFSSLIYWKSPICYFRGIRCNFLGLFGSRQKLLLANSGDPDQMRCLIWVCTVFLCTPLRVSPDNNGLISLLTLILLNKLCLPHPFFNVNWLDNSVLFFHMNSQTEWKTVQIQIRWVLKKDLHCFQRQCLSWFSRTRVD